MAIISMKKLLEAGVHFGHQTRRWNPKMAEYIFTERNGIYIIDLQKTSDKVDEAYNFIKEVVANGEEILFVGTKKQAQESTKAEAARCGMHYVSQRWLGGMLTNYQTIRKRIDKLNSLKSMEADGTFDLLTKKEVIKLKNEAEKLEKFLGGIQNMNKLPGALFVVDPRKERIAVEEARKLGIPIVAIVDTNCDPDEVDFIIPGNDDAIRAVKLIVGTLANAVVEAQGGTPIEIEFTDEPQSDDRMQRRGRNYDRRQRDDRPRRPRPPRQEVSAPIREKVETVEETEAAPKEVVKEEIGRASCRERV